MAKPKKNHIHLKFKIFHPSLFKGNDFPKINFKRGSLVKYFPKKSDKPNKILIIVGFMYKKTGLLKYNVNPPNKEITTAPIKGTYGIFFSTKYMIATAINVEIINGGIAALKLLPLL